MYLKKIDPIGPFQYQYRSHYLFSWKQGSWSLSNTIEMASENHFPLNTDIDDGGPWLMIKSADRHTAAAVNTSLFQGMVTVGGARGGWTGEDLTRPTSPTDQQIESMGTTMVARSLPNNPSSDLVVGAAEVIREGVPSLVGLQTMRSRTHAAKSAGDEYLNVEFGWKPLVSEVRSLAKSVKDHEKIWSNYRKGSSVKTRVGYHLNDDTQSVSYTGFHYPVPIDYNSSLNGTSHRTTRTRNWFKGAFKYYVPEPVDFGDKMSYWSSQASKILGVRMDPEVLWNLAPWSWAVDWFSNTGDVLHNISLLGKDGLVMQYGYAMSEQSISTSRVASVGTGQVSRDTVNKRCRRIPASPYGFGVDLSTLSSRQTAIIAALGLSKT